MYPLKSDCVHLFMCTKVTCFLHSNLCKFLKAPGNIHIICFRVLSSDSRCFGGIFRLYLQGLMRSQTRKQREVGGKCWFLPCLNLSLSSQPFLSRGSTSGIIVSFVAEDYSITKPNRLFGFNVATSLHASPSVRKFLFVIMS
jgi:hypothetical protein